MFTTSGRSPTSPGPASRSPDGPRSWPRSAASPSWSAATATTSSTGTPPHRSRSSHWRAGYPETGHVRFGGRPSGKGPAQLAPRRSADPTGGLRRELLDDRGPVRRVAAAQAAVDAWVGEYNPTGRTRRSTDGPVTPADRFSPGPGPGRGRGLVDLWLPGALGPPRRRCRACCSRELRRTVAAVSPAATRAQLARRPGRVRPDGAPVGKPVGRWAGSSGSGLPGPGR